jgi:5-methylcytosine-specific restriction endonuclease McrA
MLADSSIHLTGILLLGPHLTDDNHRDVLARARYRSKREIEKLVAELAPRNDVPARIEPLHVAPRPAADHATMMAALCGPVRNLPQGNGRGEAPVGTLAELELADESSVASPTNPSEPERHLSPALHYKVQFTADQEYMSLLEEARNLLAHVNPSRDFVEVQRKALELLVNHLRKRKHAIRTSDAVAEPDRAGAEPRGAETIVNPCDADRAEAPDAVSEIRPASADSVRRRRPTAEVARAVWQRDQGRCTYVDGRGQRCRETSMLECHHEHAWALGGVTTVDNLALRCAAHNALAAEQDFGRQHMASKRRGVLTSMGSE